MPAQTNRRRTITVDDSGTITRTPRPVRRITGVSLSARGNAISASEAVRAVQHPESDTPQTRAYYRMAASEAETLSAVRAAGGDNVFLFAGQRGEDEEDLHKVSSLVRSLDRKTLFEQPSQGDGDDLFPMPQPSGTTLIPRPIGGVDSEGNLGDIPLTYPLLTDDSFVVQVLDNAAIIVRLFRDNPQVAIQALQQFAFENQETIEGFTATAVIALLQRTADVGVFGVGNTGVGALGGASGGLTAGGMGVAVAGGVILGVAGVLLWDELTHEQEQNAPFEVIEIEESHSNVVYAETGVTPEGKEIRVRKLRDNEVRQRGLHQEKAKEGYGATDDIYVDGQDETYIHRRGARDSRGRLILNPFP